MASAAASAANGHHHHYNTLREVLQHMYGVPDLARDMPKAALGFAVFVGGLLFSVLIYTVLAYVCLGKRWRPEYDMIQGHYEQRRYPSVFRSARFIFVFLFVALLICSSIWFGSAMVGFNPWTTAAATIAISIIGTYGFAKVLGQASTAVAVHADNAIQVGEYWEFEGMGEAWAGVISAINVFNVELKRCNKEDESTETIIMPIDRFFDRARKHRPAMEKELIQRYPPMWKECVDVGKGTRKPHIA